MFNPLRVSALVLICAALLGVPDAHAQKIGYTNQEAILANMPEMQNVQQQLQQAAQQQQAELQQEQQQFQQRLEQYQKQQSLLSDSVRQVREQELRQRQQQLQQSVQQREQNLQQRESELMQPLLEELQTAISDVASEQDIDVVMRTQALLYVSESTNNAVDITRDVAEKLGIDVSGAETQPQPSVDSGNNPPNPNGQ